MTDLKTWDAWRTVHQPFELNWWKEHLPQGHEDDPGFTLFWDDVKAFIEPQGTVIEIGSGPRPAFAPCIVIEPLADEYQKLVPSEWWEGVKVFSQPAEQFIPDLRADTVVCWNCLNHTVGWRDILANMRRYGNPDARYAVATDFYPPFVGHPGFQKDEFTAEVKKHFKVVTTRNDFGRQKLAMLMKGR